MGVIGGMYGGFVTVVEAASLGAVGALLIGLARRRLAWAAIQECLVESLRTSAAIFMIIVGAYLFQYFLAITQTSQQLAEWLTSPENPLTARVMVNRVWQHLFGQGIVRTADNFGATGERPTHPELLDHLAQRFMENDWSVKKLIREIVLSRVYALGTRVDAANTQIDPGNRMLWRANARRLDAESIRDAMLTASGLMDLNPPGGSMVASIGNAQAAGYSQRFVNAQFHYRSVYLPIVRDFVPSCLEVFDFAEPSLVVANRDVTNVPAQSLALLSVGGWGQGIGPVPPKLQSIVEVSDVAWLDNPAMALQAGLRQAENGVLFISNIHRFFARDYRQESVTKALQKAFLSEGGNAVIIGTSTEAEYTDKLRSNLAIVEHSHMLRVPAATVDECQKMLALVKTSIEREYDVTIDPTATKSAAVLASRAASIRSAPPASPRASTAITVSPAPVTSQTSVRLAGSRCVWVPLAATTDMPSAPRVMTTCRAPSSWARRAPAS